MTREAFRNSLHLLLRCARLTLSRGTHRERGLPASSSSTERAFPANFRTLTFHVAFEAPPKSFHRPGSCSLRFRKRVFTSQTRSPFLRARLEERRRNFGTPSAVSKQPALSYELLTNLSGRFTVTIDSPTYPFAFSRSRDIHQGTSRNFLQADSRVPCAVLQPRTAARIDTLDRLLPTLTPTIRTRTPCLPGDPMPFDMSSAAEVWASTPKLPGTDAVHAAYSRFGGFTSRNIGVFFRRVERNRASDTPSPTHVHPLLSRASRKHERRDRAHRFSVKRKDFSDPECLPSMGTFSHSFGESFDGPKVDLPKVTY